VSVLGDTWWSDEPLPRLKSYCSIPQTSKHLKLQTTHRIELRDHPVAQVGHAAVDTGVPRQPAAVAPRHDAHQAVVGGDALAHGVLSLGGVEDEGAAAVTLAGVLHGGVAAVFSGNGAGAAGSKKVGEGGSFGSGRA